MELQGFLPATNVPELGQHDSMPDGSALAAGQASTGLAPSGYSLTASRSAFAGLNDGALEAAMPTGSPV